MEDFGTGDIDNLTIEQMGAEIQSAKERIDELESAIKYAIDVYQAHSDANPTSAGMDRALTLLKAALVSQNLEKI